VSAPKVGVVYVSHSVQIAAGLVELAAQMAPTTSLVAAGGTEDNGLGTSFERVSNAIHTADTGAGVVVLCDLGSAILTAETALDFLDAALRARVRILDAPLVEGGIAAAVAAEIGGDLDTVAAAAEAVGFGNTESVDQSDTAAQAAPQPFIAEVSGPGTVTRTVTLVNADGLHARPAADFVRLASTFSAQISVNEVDATSLLGIMGLGLTIGMHVSISAVGPDAQAAIAALTNLIESGFGE